MIILHLSDTHGLHHRIKDMPAADVIIHSGDISNNGTEERDLRLPELVHKVALSA